MTDHRPWTEEEEGYLAANAVRFTAEYIGIRINRTAWAVRGKAYRKGIRFTETRPWTKIEVFYLRGNAATMTVKEMAADLDRDEQSVLSKAAFIGVKFGYSKKYSDEQVMEVLMYHQQGLSAADIEERTGISRGVFKEYIGGRRRRNITARKG